MVEVKKKAGKRKTAKKRKDEFCTFILEILDWDLPYLFSINHNKIHGSGLYSEYLHLHIKGILREPEMFKGKTISATFIGERGLSEESNKCPVREALSVGTVTLRGDTRDFIGSLPFDIISTVAPMLETQRLKYIQLHGQAPFR